MYLRVEIEKRLLRLRQIGRFEPPELVERKYFGVDGVDQIRGRERRCGQRRRRLRQSRLEPRAGEIELISRAGGAMDFRKRAEPVSRQNTIELRFSVARHSIEDRPSDLDLRGQLIVAKEEDDAEDLGQPVADYQVLELEIPERDRRTLLEEARHAPARHARQVARVDADAGHRIANDQEFWLRFAQRGGRGLVEGFAGARR